MIKCLSTVRLRSQAQLYRVRVIAVWLNLLVSLAAASPAMSQVVEQKLWGTDGNVVTMARSGNTLYVGGAFTMVGPNTGCGVPVDGKTGAALRPYPRVVGQVNTVIPDGDGGWFIGGEFSAVGGLWRTNLAHILADGRVSVWNPGTDGAVLVLARDARTIYVGGAFTHVGGQRRNHLAALDATTGMGTSWDPSPNGRVRALLPLHGQLYVGGDFDVIGGQPRNSVAEIDVVTGAVTGWNPDVGWYGMSGKVYALASAGDTVYVGGDFASVGGHSRLLLASVDMVTGAVTDWDPRGTGPEDSYYGNAYVSALAVHGRSVYVAGHFTGVGGVSRSGLAAVDLENGSVAPWNPGIADVSTALAVRDSTVCVAGWFTSLGGQARNYVAELDLQTGAATAWDPNANDGALTLAACGNAVYIGGMFTGLGSEWQRRMGLAALDATTGALRPWNPDPNGYIIETLAVSHGRVYVGGHFSFIGGQTRYGLAALDTLTGVATPWNPTPNSVVGSLVTVGDTLYAGGYFTMMSGQPRGRLASFDLLTGELTTWNPNANSDVYGIAVQGNIAYLTGFFWTVGGLRRLGIAAVDAVTGEVLPWDPAPDNVCSTVALVGDTVFVGGTFTSIGGQPRTDLAAVSATTGLALPWIADANSTVGAVLRLGDTLFVGGTFSRISGQSRVGLAALDLATGRALDWDPGVSSATWLNPGVNVIVQDGSKLYIGGGFGAVGGIPASSLVAIDFGPVIPQPPLLPKLATLARMSPNPVHSNATIRYAVPSTGPVSLAVFDVQGRRVVSLVDQQLRSAGWYEEPMDAAGWPRGFYFCRLEAGGASATLKFVVLR